MCWGRYNVIAIMIMLKKRKRKELKMNFSVGVNMYSENVTSYWYLFLCSHRNVDANIVIVSDLLECFEVYWGAVSSGVVGRESRGETKGSKGRRWIVNGSPI